MSSQVGGDLGEVLQNNMCEPAIQLFQETEEGQVIAIAPWEIGGSVPGTQRTPPEFNVLELTRKLGIGFSEGLRGMN